MTTPPRDYADDHYPYDDFDENPERLGAIIFGVFALGLFIGLIL